MSAEGKSFVTTLVITTLLLVAALATLELAPRLQAGPVVATTGAPGTAVSDAFLLDNRFRVSTTWRAFDGSSGLGWVVPGNANDSAIYSFFDAENWELLVKVLDGCGVNNRVWVFVSATTNVEYEITVEDTVTGQVSTYFNPLGEQALAVTDTDAFAVCSSLARPTPTPTATELGVQGVDGRSLAQATAGAKDPHDYTLADLGVTDAARASAAGVFTDTLALQNGRFQVSVDWQTSTGQAGFGVVAPLFSSESGIFYFFDAENWEMLVKVVDGCGVNERLWVLASAATDVRFVLTVMDTATGRMQRYSNPDFAAAPAIIDIEAFDRCDLLSTTTTTTSVGSSSTTSIASTTTSIPGTTTTTTIGGTTTSTTTSTPTTTTMPSTSTTTSGPSTSTSTTTSTPTTTTSVATTTTVPTTTTTSTTTSMPTTTTTTSTSTSTTTSTTSTTTTMPAGVSYANDVYPLFSGGGGCLGCHVGAPACGTNGSLILSNSAGNVYNQLLNQSPCAGDRVNPGNPDGSLLILKPSGRVSMGGSTTPRPGWAPVNCTTNPNTDYCIAFRWIQEGANNN